MIGSIVVAVGVKAPAVLLVSFVPMFFIAAAFFYMNRVDTDCGTTFSWVTRALGPYAGWIGGFAICTTGILVVGSLADVSAYYFYDLLGLDVRRRQAALQVELAVATLAVAIIAVMTTICVIGTELSAHLQRVLTLGQVAILLLFAGGVFVRLIIGKVPDELDRPRARWLSPFGVEYSALLTRRAAGRLHLLGLGERGQPLGGDRGLRPGARAGRHREHGDPASCTYIAVTVALIAYAGLGRAGEVRRRRGRPRRRSASRCWARRSASCW